MRPSVLSARASAGTSIWRTLMTRAPCPRPTKLLPRSWLGSYIHACTYAPNPSPAQSTEPERAARVGSARPVPVRLREPRARGRGARGGLHARRAVPPVQGQGGLGARGDRVGQRELDPR